MSLTATDFLNKINRHGGVPASPLRPVPGECWTFESWHNSAGYPYIHHEGRDQPAHRVVFHALTGRDLTGLDLDHVCRNVACVNPGHEEPVTHAENMRRLSQAQTACRLKGHDWSIPRNVYTRPNGLRYCAECDRARSLARHHARKASA